MYMYNVTLKCYLLTNLLPIHAHHAAQTKSMPEATFNRAVDIYCRNVGLEMSQNNNVELRERDGFRCFPHGVTGYVISQKRIDGGWHVSIARHFRVFMCTTSLLRNSTKKLFCQAYTLLLQVHVSLRTLLLRKNAKQYQLDINELLECTKRICERTSPSACNSAKYHLPYHWLDTRLQLGCSPAGKSLERKLGEAQKKYFPFTNGKRDGTQVYRLHYICAYEM
jgi:hypothetical protein